MTKRTYAVLAFIGVLAALGVGFAAGTTYGTTAFGEAEQTAYDEALELVTAAHSLLANHEKMKLGALWDNGCSILRGVEAAQARVDEGSVHFQDYAKVKAELEEAKDSVYEAMVANWARYTVIYSRWPEWCDQPGYKIEIRHG